MALKLNIEKPRSGGRSPRSVGSAANPNQIALLRWYSANLTTAFSVGTGPQGVAFDGLNIWVANAIDNTVTKLRAATGAPQGTFSGSLEKARPKG